MDEARQKAKCTPLHLFLQNLFFIYKTYMISPFITSYTSDKYLYKKDVQVVQSRSAPTQNRVHLGKRGVHEGVQPVHVDIRGVQVICTGSMSQNG